MLPSTGLVANKKTTFSFLIIVLFSAYLLLPLDRGFPDLMVGGRTLSTSILVSLFVFLPIMFLTGLRLSKQARVFLGLHLVFFCVYLVGAICSDSALSAVRGSLIYFFTFIINFLSIYSLLLRGMRKTIVNVICIVGATAAAIAILDSVFKIQLPLYQSCMLSYQQKDVIDLFDITQTRSTGTLGNEIVFCVAMMTCIPFALELRSKTVKWCLAALFVFAAMLTVTRTIFLMCGVLLIGFMVSSNKKKVMCYLAGLITAGFAAVLSADFFTGHLDKNPVVDLWLQRIGFVSGAFAGGSVSGVQLRREGALNAVDSIFGDGVISFLFGHGNNADAEIGRSLAKGLSTVDNTYIALWYNNGIVGLLAFIVIYWVLLVTTRRMGGKTLHWYNVLAVLVSGFTFVFYSYSTFNLLLVASSAMLIAGTADPRQLEATAAA